MKKLLLFCLSTIMFSTVFAQMGVNTKTPDQSSVLDIRNKESEYKGVLFPKMTDVEVNKISNPTNGLLVYNIDKNCLYINKGSSSSINWVCNDSGNSTISMPEQLKFFYMPTITIEIESSGIFYRNLYDEYKNQFQKPMVSSPGSKIIPVYKNSELDYYITYYDDKIFSNVSIDINGILSYTINNISIEETSSYMNIVFGVKN